MAAFATADDLAAGWPGCPLSTEADRSVATELLIRASAVIRKEMAGYGVVIDPADVDQATVLLAATCNMVRRAVTAFAGDGVGSLSQGIGSTTASINFSNPDGSLYLSASEREALGLYRRSEIYSIWPSVFCSDEEE